MSYYNWLSLFVLQITDEQLADADRAKAIAEEAIAKAEETLQHANNTYYTLLGM